MAEDKSDTRSTMKDFWDAYSDKTTVATMMLNPKAAEFSHLEEEEIKSALPPLEGLVGVELAAGIGRYSGYLAEKSKHITVVDFVDSFIAKNKEINGHLSNIEFVCGDALKLEIEENSLDYVFINWLFMYLSEEESVLMFTKMLTWLKPTGFLYFRESCSVAAGSYPDGFVNPTYYRSPLEYNKFLCDVSVVKQGEKVAFETIVCRPLSCYIKHLGVMFQYTWLCKLSSVTEDRRLIADESRITDTFITTCESVLGKGYMSPGAKNLTDLLSAQTISETDNVLVVNSALGGVVFDLLEKVKCSITGVEITVIGLDKSLARAKELGVKDDVKFLAADLTLFNAKENSFDVIAVVNPSRIVLSDKKPVFEKVMKYLKPNGKLLMVDFTSESPEVGEGYKKLSGKSLEVVKTVEDYKNLLESVGFVNVTTDDWSERSIVSGTALSNILPEPLKAATEKGLDMLRTGTLKHLAITATKA